MGLDLSDDTAPGPRLRRIDSLRGPAMNLDERKTLPRVVRTHEYGYWTRVKMR